MVGDSVQSWLVKLGWHQGYMLWWHLAVVWILHFEGAQLYVGWSNGKYELIFGFLVKFCVETVSDM